MLNSEEKAILNSNQTNGKQPQQPIAPATAPTADETTALTVLTQTAAGTIRQSIGAMSQFAEKLEDQRDLVTTHAADRITAILNPVSIQAEIAAKTVSQLEGKSFVPFELEPIELPKVRRYVPQLPQFYASESLPSLASSSTPSDAEVSETILPGKSRTEAGKGFGTQRKDS
jgi:hypothetical protein